ncbi:MAG: MazG family protein [Desulfuromonadales bacterium]|nr:MazG family protein [Desulfuromonadales bacterium]
MPVNRNDDPLARLLATMAALRAPGGCPWDREQTPQSLTPYILEEACELIDAIEADREDQIRDELGDLLLQVVFQAQIFAEQGRFGFADVAAAIDAKLRRRHPHVFGERGSAIQSEEELHRQWESIKRSEKNADDQPRTVACLLPRQLPALQKAQKMVRKMRQAGLARPLVEPAQPQSPTGDDAPERVEGRAVDAERIGRQLLHWVMQAEDAGIDAETALRKQIARHGKTPLHDSGASS